MVCILKHNQINDSVFFVFITEKITLVFEHYENDISTKASKFTDIDSIVKCGLYALYHLHYVIGTVHGMITPSSFLYVGENKFKLTHWAINLITNCGELCQSLICPDDTRFLSIEQLLMSKPIRKSDIWSFGLTILYFMFPNHQIKFPSDPFVLSNCVDSNEVFEKLGINSNELEDKWVRFFNATLQSCPEKRSTVKELMEILSVLEPKSYKSNLSEIDHLIRYYMVI